MVETQRIPLNVLFGLPDSGKASIRVLDGGTGLDFDLPGTVDLATHLSPERFAQRVIYVDGTRGKPLRVGPGALLNHVGDADICSRALDVISEIVVETGRPCFNHPRAVARTGRDRVSRVLAGLAGLTVPKTIRVPGEAPDEVRSAIAAAGLEYPVLIRVSGSHRGMNMVRVDTPAAVDEITGLSREAGNFLYVTEFRDFASPDGRYRKYRIAVVGDDAFVRHMITSDDWIIHGIPLTGSARQEEEAAFGIFDTDIGLHLRWLFGQIGRRLGLDFFGVDCNIAPDGQVLLFEANACMGILGNTQAAENAKTAAIARIKEAVEQLLAATERWRTAQAAAHLALARS
jgi:glutathione synthase/RimK-type ligase-like ATP-grasp enzyme